MRKKHIVAAGLAIAALLIPNTVSTPVLAGTTQAKLEESDEARIDTTFSGRTLGNLDHAFAGMSTVATKTGVYDQATGRNTYAVTDADSLKYRIYFNDKDSSGETHALCTGGNIFRIIPSGTNGQGTNDVSKWPFPDMESVAGDTDGMNAYVGNTVQPRVLYGVGDPYVSDMSNATCVTDSESGILSWMNTMDLLDDDIENYLTAYETDAHGAYFTSGLALDTIVGKPGDKLEVQVFQRDYDDGFNPVMSIWSFTTYPTPDPFLFDTEQANHENVLKQSGYIYIPYTLTYDSNGGGTAPTADELYTCDANGVTVQGQGNMTKTGAKFLGWSESQIAQITDAADVPSDLKKAGTSFNITDDMTLYAVWGDEDLVVPVDVEVPLYKRVVQNGSGVLPDMTFAFTFEQKSEWEGVSYVSTATPIPDKSVTIREADRYTGSDPYVGDLTGKKLYYGEYANVLSDFAPQAAGTYLYLVKEKVPATGAIPNVTYTGSEYVLKVVVDSNLEISDVPTITLYKDSAGKTKTDYTTPPRVFEEKQELIFYNSYGTSGGTTPTGIMTNILPFIVIGGAGAGCLALYVIFNVKRKKKEMS